jgi:LPS export ABC transporter protein LptC
MTGVTHAFTSAGVRSASGVFDTVYVYVDSPVYGLRGVRIRMFDPEGIESATLQADSGTLNTMTSELIARGNVELATPKGCRLRTESVLYEPNERRFRGDGYARVDSGEMTDTTTGFSADDRLSSITFLRSGYPVSWPCS